MSQKVCAKNIIDRFRSLIGNNIQLNDVHRLLARYGCKPIYVDSKRGPIYNYDSGDNYDMPSVDGVLNKIYWDIKEGKFILNYPKKEKEVWPEEDYSAPEEHMKNFINNPEFGKVDFYDENDDELYESLCKKHKTIFLNENQLNYIKENNWKQEFYDNNIKNGVIKLYHNTTTDNLDNIINDGEIKSDMHHSEGHGNMIWFTVKEDDYANQSQISITVDEDTFKKNFELMNSIHVITYHNIPTDKFNFKIEKIEGLTYDRIMEILSEDDNKLIKVLSENLPASVWNWFLEKYDNINSLNESLNFIEPEKVKIVKNYLDSNFIRASMLTIGDDGYQKDVKLVGMISINNGNKNVLKNMTAQQLFYLLQDKFQKIYSDKEKRDKFLKRVMIDWYNKKISKEGLLSVNKY